MTACIILHNMIIEDEGFSAERWAPEDGASTSHGIATPPLQMGVPRSNEYLIWLKRSGTVEEGAQRDRGSLCCSRCIGNFRCIIFLFL